MICSDETLRNLRDAGCDDERIREYCTIAAKPLPEAAVCGQQARLLIGYRKELLNQLHEDQRKIDCLDYLLYRLRERSSQG